LGGVFGGVVAGGLVGGVVAGGVVGGGAVALVGVVTGVVVCVAGAVVDGEPATVVTVTDDCGTVVLAEEEACDECETDGR
jgi:hypothetical protein